MKTKHTPAPWKDKPNGIVENRYIIATVNLESAGIMTEQEAIANRKLIAAAPELLEALMAVYSDIDLDKHGSSELNVIVQNAIKKATE